MAVQSTQMTFGRIITLAREEASLNQKQLAALIKKENGVSISAPYLNDIEHDRRTPSSDYMINEFSRVLQIPVAVLYYAARRLPASAYKFRVDKERVIAAFEAFHRELRGQSRGA
jgi:transcriptional regulator with XRE-family HTH domain